MAALYIVTTTPVPETKRILIIDDDDEITALVKEYLERYEFVCETASKSAGIIKDTSIKNYDLIILDIMLHGENGIDICHKIRRYSSIPIIFLSAISELCDRVLGLEAGADDYLVKPFEPRELVARIRTNLRHKSTRFEIKNLDKKHYEQLLFGRWSLNITTRELISKDKMYVQLSNAEFRLLWEFLQSPNKLLTRDQLMDGARGKHCEAFDRSIDLLVSRLRQKLRDHPNSPTLIKTIRGEGYIFTERVKPLETHSL